MTVELLASLAMPSVITDVGVTFSVLMHELELDLSANGNSGDSIRRAKFKKAAADVDVVESFTTTHSLCNHCSDGAATQKGWFQKDGSAQPGSDVIGTPCATVALHASQ